MKIKLILFLAFAYIIYQIRVVKYHTQKDVRLLQSNSTDQIITSDNPRTRVR